MSDPDIQRKILDTLMGGAWFSETLLRHEAECSAIELYQAMAALVRADRVETRRVGLVPTWRIKPGISIEAAR